MEIWSVLNYKKNCLSEVDKLCFDWFAIARSKNLPISGQIVSAKAKEIAEKIDYNGFSALGWWLQKWRKRHNIAFKCISEEAADVTPEDVMQFKTTSFSN